MRSCLKQKNVDISRVDWKLKSLSPFCIGESQSDIALLKICSISAEHVMFLQNRREITNNSGETFLLRGSELINKTWSWLTKTLSSAGACNSISEWSRLRNIESKILNRIHVYLKGAFSHHSSADPEMKDDKDV